MEGDYIGIMSDIWIDRKIYEFFHDHNEKKQILGMPEKEYLRFLKSNHPKQYKKYKKYLKDHKEEKRLSDEEINRMTLPTWYTPRFFKV